MYRWRRRSDDGFQGVGPWASLSLAASQLDPCLRVMNELAAEYHCDAAAATRAHAINSRLRTKCSNTFQLSAPVRAHMQPPIARGTQESVRLDIIYHINVHTVTHTRCMGYINIRLIDSMQQCFKDKVFCSLTE